MPSFSDSIFLFILALLLFGPKKLPVLARELGKWVGEFRRASNEFKMQMEEELRQSEQADRLKQIEAIEAAAPPAPALPIPETTTEPTPETTTEAAPATTTTGVSSEEPAAEAIAEPAPLPTPAEPLPIAQAGELKIMPPSTGLPTPRKSALSSMLDAVPSAPTTTPTTQSDTAETPHGH